MNKKIAITVLVIMCVMFIVGLILIFSAPAIGLDAANDYILNNGGHMDTTQFERIIDGTTVSYQMGGLVISLVGGFGLLISGHALLKKA